MGKTNKRLLIVDDDEEIRELLVFDIQSSGYTVDSAKDGEEGLKKAVENNYDLILLDVMMPNMDGFEVASKLRQNKCNVPILMLTAKDEVASRVKGLDCGADDYLTKPFASEELLARIRALTRRQTELVFDELKFEDITLNTSNYTLTCGQKSVTLGAKEYEILRFLMMNANHVISKDTIISKIWGLDSDITENNVEAYMSFLRKKLFFVGSSVTIMTKRLLGYYLEKTE